MVLTDEQKKIAVSLFRDVQARLVQAYEKIDGNAKFTLTDWSADADSEGPMTKGGGTVAVLRGEVVEKAGANVSEVYGDKYPAVDSAHKDKAFFAAGVSTITHMFNPNAPIAHMNVRVLDVGDTFWVGGGADLTPFLRFDEDTEEFHAALRDSCKDQGADAYERYSKWCDEYFYIPHRHSTRGVGGIFFDYLEAEFEPLMGFLGAVTNAYLTAYPNILERRKAMAFDDKMKDDQLYWRGRYAEFNLVYDRGTKFGLMTGGNADRIFVSMPPVVKW
jgi:coproporphyrinogen III oxidase